MTPDDAKAELEMWGRWARQSDGPKGYGEPSIWSAWLSYKSRVAGWGLTEAEQEAEKAGVHFTQSDDRPPPIDDVAAQQTDRILMALRGRSGHSFTIIRLHFYKLRRQQDDDLYPALRQYVDLRSPGY